MILEQGVELGALTLSGVIMQLPTVKEARETADE